MNGAGDAVASWGLGIGVEGRGLLGCGEDGPADAPVGRGDAETACCCCSWATRARSTCPADPVFCCSAAWISASS